MTTQIQSHTKTRSLWKRATGRLSGWTIGDEVVTLREIGTSTSFRLPSPESYSGEPWTIGASASCQLRISDETVSRVHASLLREDGHWVIADRNSKNGLQVDGLPQPRIRLAAGQVVSVGAVRLVAESLSFITLRGFIERLLGWEETRLAVVDEALQHIRTAQLRRDPLVLVGDGELTLIARDLHDYLLGEGAPFVTCDRRRNLAEEATARSSRNEQKLSRAVEVAAGGTVYVPTKSFASDFVEVTALLRTPGQPRVQLIVGGPTTPDLERVRCATPIYLPSLATRATEVNHIITEYLHDAKRELELEHGEITAEDREWICESSKTMADVSRATRRLLALRMEGSILGAARRLGMAAVSLRRWADRRELPARVETGRRGKLGRWLGKGNN